jgi:hypothetical protein
MEFAGILVDIISKICDAYVEWEFDIMCVENFCMILLSVGELGEIFVQGKN